MSNKIKDLIREQVELVVENVNMTYIQNLGKVSFPRTKGININMMPFVFGS